MTDRSFAAIALALSRELKWVGFELDCHQALQAAKGKMDQMLKKSSRYLMEGLNRIARRLPTVSFIFD